MVAYQLVCLLLWMFNGGCVTIYRQECNASMELSPDEIRLEETNENALYIYGVHMPTELIEEDWLFLHCMGLQG